MTIRSIRQAPGAPGRYEVSELLKQATEPVTERTVSEAMKVANDLLDTMASQPLCVGLAANQIGSALAVAVISFPGTDEAPLVLLNPVLLEASGKKDKKRESCMSVWGMTGEVERRSKARVGYQDVELVYHEREFDGFVSRIVQHEVDHLRGILYTDFVRAGGVFPTTLFEGFAPSAD